MPGLSSLRPGLCLAFVLAYFGRHRDRSCLRIPLRIKRANPLAFSGPSLIWVELSVLPFRWVGISIQRFVFHTPSPTCRSHVPWSLVRRTEVSISLDVDTTISQSSTQSPMAPMCAFSLLSGIGSRRCDRSALWSLQGWALLFHFSWQIPRK